MSGAGVTPTIGVCEDDDELRGILRDALQREGMTAVSYTHLTLPTNSRV